MFLKICPILSFLVLIHINPNRLNEVYDKLYMSSKKYRDEQKIDRKLSLKKDYMVKTINNITKAITNTKSKTVILSGI